MFETFRRRISEAYGDLNDREKLLVKVAGVVLPLVALAFVAILFNQSLATVRSDIEGYERTLKLLGDVAPSYASRQEEGESRQSEQFSNEAIESNDLDLTSFVATHATAVGVQVDTYDESQRPIGSEGEGDDESSLYKHQVTVKVRDATIDKIRKLLERIETADKPVVIERIKISKKDRDEAKVRSDLVVTTFKRKAKG